MEITKVWTVAKVKNLEVGDAIQLRGKLFADTAEEDIWGHITRIEYTPFTRDKEYTLHFGGLAKEAIVLDGDQRVLVLKPCAS